MQSKCWEKFHFWKVENIKENLNFFDEELAVDEAKVNLVFEPVWEPHMMSEDAKEIMGASGAAISW